MKTLNYTDLRHNEDGAPVADCEACGCETLWTRADHLTRKYSCLSCMCNDTMGAIPTHGYSHGAHFHINEKNGIGAMFIHYSADPEKNPDTKEGAVWLRRERKLYASRPDDWNRLYEIEFRGTSGPRIFPMFDETLSLKPDLGYIKDKPLMCQFDFGTLHPAFSVAQWDDKGNYRVLFEVLGFDPHIEHWFDMLGRIFKVELFSDMGLGNAECDRVTFEDLHNRGLIVSYGDPAGHQRDRFKMSDIRFATNYGWNIHGKVSSSPIRKIDKMRAMMYCRDDGLPRFYLRGRTYKICGDDMPVIMDKREPGTVLAGCCGGYAWRQDNKGALIQPLQPNKDIHSHLIDTCLEGIEWTYDMDVGEPVGLPHPLAGSADFFEPENEDGEDYASAKELAKWYYNQQDTTLEEPNYGNVYY